MSKRFLNINNQATTFVLVLLESIETIKRVKIFIQTEEKLAQELAADNFQHFEI